MKQWLVVVLLLVCYGALSLPLKQYMAERPVAIKLGYTPSAEALKLSVGDQKTLVAELSTLKVLFYFGSLVENWKNQIIIPPEQLNMYRTIETVVKLDPYNMDAYYFAQSAFTWEVGHAADVNRLLIHGMKYRPWDWYLPYFVGFNAAYFLKDYETAGRYMRIAAEISGNSLFTKLAARYFYEAGHNDLGILFLRSMVEKAGDPKVKKAYQLRLDALVATATIETAVGNYLKRFGVVPASLDSLVGAGILTEIPRDPYGGCFYLDESGKVRSTSHFALPPEERMQNQ